MSEAQPMTRDQISAAIAERAWKDEAFHREVLANPSKVYEQHFGQPLPAGVTIKVVEDSASTVHFVIPAKPANTGELSDDELENVAGGITPSAFALICSIGAVGMFSFAIGSAATVEANKTAKFW